MLNMIREKEREKKQQHKIEKRELLNEKLILIELFGVFFFSAATTYNSDGADKHTFIYSNQFNLVINRPSSASIAVIITDLFTLT